MSYTGKQPDFEVVVIKPTATTPSAPVEGFKIFIEDGKLYTIDSEGKEAPLGAAGASKALTFFLS